MKTRYSTKYSSCFCHSFYHIIICGLSLWLANTSSLRAAPLQQLHGQVRAAWAHLQPLGNLPGTNRLHLTIGLPLRNQAELDTLLKQVSDPASPDYRHYLTPAQFTERFGPTKGNYQAVIAFAKSHGLRVTATYPNRMILDVEGSVADIDKALHVTLREYQHPTEHRRFYAPDTKPSVNLAVPILHISGLDNYSLPRPLLHLVPLSKRQNALPNTGSGPSGSYLGSDFRAAYAPDTTLDGSGQAVGLLEFDGYMASDIAYYENLAGLPNVTLTNELIGGATGVPQTPGGAGEVSLDIEMAISMAPNLSEVIVYEATNGSSWVSLLNQMANDTNSLGQPLARQLSCSWAGGGTNAEADQIFQQMAVQGQSFFAASGDHDAWIGQIPFPCDNPYITVVGGTTLTNSGANGSWVSESVWNWGNGTGSGGGISTSYPIPWWQTNVNMTANHGSTTMRNVPDVALTAANVYVRASGTDYDTVGGTSCAAPLWAGFCALINQQAAAQGNPPVGFINPAIYAIGNSPNYASAFHDITNGDNTWPATIFSRGSPTNFYAVAGYDLCTGWGTPTGQALIDALANYDALIISPLYGFNSAGVVGGPFSVTSQNLLLTNAGASSLNWAVGDDSQSWLKVSPATGTLTAGGSAQTVTVSLKNKAGNLSGGTYIATLSFTNLNDNVVQSRQYTLSVVTPPTIPTQPADQAVLEGAPATFNVGATGGLLQYQWQFNGTNLVDGGNISGSTSATLTVSNVSSADVGSYSVIVSNIAGVAVSSSANLSITPSAPVILRQPTDQSVVPYGTATFSVTVVGRKPYSYQWSFNGTDIVGATNATLTLTDVQFNQAGNYAVLVSNALGSTLSAKAVLTVLTVSVPDSFNPGAQGAVLSTAVQSDGKVVVGCLFGLDNAVGNIGDWNVGRLNADGTLDTNFIAVADNTVNCLGVQTDGKILLSGDFTGLDVTNQPFMLGTNQSYIGRVNADGTLDTNFNGFASNEVFCLAVQADGKILVGGDFTNLDGQSQAYIGRLNADGTLDTSFEGFANNTVNCLAVQADGKILVGGNFTTLDGQSISYLGRLNADGTLDTSFNPGMEILPGFDPEDNNVVNCLAVQADGEILVGGNFSGINHQSQEYLGRFNANGGQDATFDVNGPVNSLVLQADGKILVGGTFTELDGQNQPNLGRLNADGTLDTTFTPQANGTVLSLALQADGEILVGGTFNLLGGYLRNNIGRLTPTYAATQSLTFDGSTITWLRGGSSPEVWRTTFDISTNGTTWIPLGAGTRIADGWELSGLNWPTNASLRARGFVTGGWDDGSAWYVETDYEPPVITTQPSSQTVLVGSDVTFSVGAASFDTPLSYQWLFNGAAIVGATNATLTLTSVQLSQAGNYSVIVSNMYGSITSSTAVLTVLPPSVPDSFNPGWVGVALCTALQPDGKVLVGGQGSLGNAVGNIGAWNIGRLNSDGTLDTNFIAVANNTVNCLAVQTDGKILLGGDFTGLDITNQPFMLGTNQSYIGRVNADGTLDTNFNGFANNAVYCLALQSDGKILVGGNFTTLDGQSQSYLGRLNTDGTLDTSFSATANGTVNCLAVQTDGKILVGGNFTTLDGQSQLYLARLNPDGTLDSTFTFGPPEPIGPVNSLVLQTDGKILVAGNLVNSGEQSVYLMRLNANGGQDTGFNPGMNGSVNSLVLQTDGKILVGGNFTTLDGQSQSFLGRLNPDGTLDTTFTPGANSPVLSLALQTYGKILVGGTFSTLGGQGRAGIGRLTPTTPATQSLTFDGSTITWLRGGSSPEVWQTTFDVSTNGTTWIPLGAGIRIAGGWQLSGLNWPTNADLRARGYVTGGWNDGSAWYVETDYGPITTNQPSGQAVLVGTVALPKLSFEYSGGKLQISWPAPTSNVAISNVVLESSEDLLPGSWVTVPGAPQLVGNRYIIQLKMSGSQRFYRLTTSDGKQRTKRTAN